MDDFGVSGGGLGDGLEGVDLGGLGRVGKGSVEGSLGGLIWGDFGESFRVLRQTVLRTISLSAWAAIPLAQALGAGGGLGVGHPNPIGHSSVQPPNFQPRQPVTH